MSLFRIDNEVLAAAARDEQLELLERWFRSRYEDPAQRTPYEGREGGYIYIWGGPYDAREELSNFDEVVPDDVIDELVDTLEQECHVWAPTEREGDYDESLFDAVSSNTRSFQTLCAATEQLRALLKVPTPALELAHYLRLLHANAISILETYLADTATNRILADAETLQRYLDWDKHFAERKVSYRDVIREAAKAKAAARDELLDLVWHNLPKAKELYAKVFGVDIGPIDELGRAVALRHDIVHRNGRTKGGDEVSVSEQSIMRVVIDVEQLARRVDFALETGRDIEDGVF